jgi:DNA-binding response OmpR family regulator
MPPPLIMVVDSDVDQRSFTDVRLDDISGYEVFRQLKDRHGDELAVIFISHDRTDPTDVEAGLMLGADDYLAKPLQGGELLARVMAVLRRERLLGITSWWRRFSCGPRFRLF